VGGVAFGTTLGSGAEAACPSRCSSSGLATGTLVGLRGGYELPFHLAVELAAGHLSLSRKISRAVDGPVLKAPDGSTVPVTYALDDLLRLRGVWLGGGASFHAPIAGSWHLLARATAAALFARSADVITGTAATSAGSVPVGIEGVNDEVTSTALLLMPELGVQKTLGSWRVGGSIGAVFLPLGGPDFTRGALTVSPACSSSVGTSAGCTPDSSAIARERAFGRVGMIVPQISVTYEM
jgi:hypothetical protein